MKITKYVQRVINIVKGLCINHIKYEAPKELLDRIRNSVNEEGIHDLDLVAQIPGLSIIAIETIHKQYK